MRSFRAANKSPGAHFGMPPPPDCSLTLAFVGPRGRVQRGKGKHRGRAQLSPLLYGFAPLLYLARHQERVPSPFFPNVGKLQSQNRLRYRVKCPFPERFRNGLCSRNLRKSQVFTQAANFVCGLYRNFAAMHCKDGMERGEELHVCIYGFGRP